MALSMRPQSKWIKNRRPGIRSGFVLKVVFSSWMWDFGKTINSVILQGFFFFLKSRRTNRALFILVRVRVIIYVRA